MRSNVTTERVAWSLQEIARATGLSLGFLRNEVRRGGLRVKRFGRRVLVLDEDLKIYLSEGSRKEDEKAA
ncbi:MAG: DNA-binding protein [Rubrivivax sp.]|nr:DNA-binding protein [Pyrinomonadaceae bacterium]